MGWTRRKTLVQAGFRPFRRIGTRIAVTVPRRPCPPVVTPDLIRGDNGGRRRSRSWAQSPCRNSKPGSSGLVPGIHVLRHRGASRERVRRRRGVVPGTSPGTTEETSRAADGAPGDGGVPGRASLRHADPRIEYADSPAPRERTVGICRRKCRQAGRVGKCRHSRPASAGCECRVDSDLSTRCLCRRREPAPGPAGSPSPGPSRKPRTAIRGKREGRR